MTEAPYFTFDGDKYHPGTACRGPWDPGSLSGSVVVALLAHVIEQRLPGDDYMPARLTVDMYRLPGFSPIELTTGIVRDGYRIKVIDAEFVSGGISMARATCQMLRKTGNSAVRVWSPEDWKVPMPEDIPVTEEAMSMGSRLHLRITGAMGEFGQKRMWLSDQRQLVDDEPLTPWMRVALIADFTNPFANFGEGGLGYINSDVTLYLHRLPVDVWLGMEVVNHQAADGIAIGGCRLFDRKGAIGATMVTGLAQRKEPDQGPWRKGS